MLPTVRHTLNRQTPTWPAPSATTTRLQGVYCPTTELEGEDCLSLIPGSPTSTPPSRSWLRPASGAHYDTAGGALFPSPAGAPDTNAKPSYRRGHPCPLQYARPANQ